MLRVSNLSKCFSQNISSKKGFSLIVFASKWRSWIYWSYFFSEERNKFVRVSFDRAILCSTSVLMTVVTWVHLTNHIAPNKRCTVDKDTGNKCLLCSSPISVPYLKNSHDKLFVFWFSLVLYALKFMALSQRLFNSKHIFFLSWHAAKSIYWGT